MIPQKNSPKVPLDGYADNPQEVNKLFSRYTLRMSLGDLQRKKYTGGHMDDLDGQMDDLLSRELLQLSLQDRNAINEEIHGVRTIAPKESPEMLAEQLRNMDIEINKIEMKDAFDRSQQFPNTYINQAEFRLRFLRADLFEAQKAALKMVNFLDLISELFGDFALRRQIQMSDFSREEMQIFRVGHQQLLPYRDRSGRRIYSSVGGFGMDVPLVSRVKILIYITLAASEDVETQKKGLTSIVWPGKKLPASDHIDNVQVNRILFLKRVYACLPVRTCSLHFCAPSTPFFQLMRSLIVVTMSKETMNRIKFHVGETIELQYCMKTYGIPIELIPLTDTGNIKTTYLKQWMKLRRILEVTKMTKKDNDNYVSIIECPRSKDVVFRSGTSMSCHPGNVHFRCLVESKHESPSIISQTTQAELAEQLIAEIESGGGRFLKWDNRGYWTELKDRLHIHTKVALAIRDYKYKTKAQRNRQENQSYTYLFRYQDGNKRKREKDTEIMNCNRSRWANVK